MIRASRLHLEDVEETYFEHLAAAFQIAVLMLRAGVGCAIYGVVPALCTTTASRCLAEVQQLFADRQVARLDKEGWHRVHGRLWGS